MVARVLTRAPLWIVLALAIPVLSVAASVKMSANVLLDQGRRIYREGVLPSGESLRARVADGAELRGTQAACSNCHRRSGFGTSEGGRVVPPIAGDTLFIARRPSLPGRPGPANSPLGARPAYSTVTLAHALQSGTDPNGQPLSNLMPRYDLAPAALDALIAYVRTLSRSSPPGVTVQEMHLATVITPGVSSSERDSMIGVLEAFIRDHNAEMRQETRRAERVVLGHSRSYRGFRQWRLHVWTLEGESTTWRDQLEQAQKRQPVFALVSGLSHGAWQPIHDFCEQHETPCLFPNVDMPPIKTDFYSLYLSRGVALEADLVAHVLRETNSESTRNVTQVFLDNEPGRGRAAALHGALNGERKIQLTDRAIPTGQDQAAIGEILARQRDSDIIFWLGREELEKVAARNLSGQGRIILSSVLIGDPQHVPATLRGRALLIHPYELPAAWQPRRGQLERWLKARGLSLTNERIQANTYFTMHLLTKASKHFRDSLSQDYLVEKLEHATENTAWRSVYREMALGANDQRFAAKGGYIVKWTDGSSANLDATWINP